MTFFHQDDESPRTRTNGGSISSSASHLKIGFELCARIFSAFVNLNIDHEVPLEYLHFEIMNQLNHPKGSTLQEANGIIKETMSMARIPNDHSFFSFVSELLDCASAEKLYVIFNLDRSRFIERRPVPLNGVNSIANHRHQHSIRLDTARS